MRIYQLTGICLGLLLGLTACEEDRLTEEVIMPDEVITVPSTVQEGVQKVDNPYWAYAESYPGLVPDSVHRYTEGVSVEIVADWVKMHPNCRFTSYNQNTKPWYSIGYYAPPAEVITIVKPKGLNTEVKYRIGSTHCNLDHTKKLSRYPEIYTTGTLKDDTTRVYNYFGGHIYLIPQEPISTPQTFQIFGAVKAPDFFMDKTDVNEWLKELQTTAVPMAQFSSKQVVWTMPTRIMKNIKDAVEFQQLLEYYDDVILHDYFDYTGISLEEVGEVHGALSFPGMHVTDIQVCAGAAHSGYPAMYGETYGEKGIQLSVMQSMSAWGFYHEFGHGFQCPAWMWSTDAGSINEVNNNFHILHSYTRRNGMWPEETVSPWQSVIDRYVKVEDEAKDFDAGTGTVLSNVINEDKARIIPFMQLAQEYGWRLYAYVYREARELSNADYEKVKSDAVTRRNFFCMKASEYAERNLRPFFDAWGIKYTIFAGMEMAKLPALDEGNKFWEVFDAKAPAPSFESKDMAGLQRLDLSKVWSAGHYDREGWTVTTSVPYVPDGSTGKPEDMFDGSGSTFLSMHKPGKGGNTAKIVPEFTIDLQSELSFNYFTWRHRTNNTSVGLRLQEVSMYGSNTGNEDDFTLIKANVAIDVSNNNEQKFELGDIYSYRYVRFVYEKWDTVNSMSIQVSEVNLGI